MEELWRFFLNLAGSWNLHVCALAGCFTLESAVDLLPSCLLHIALQFCSSERHTNLLLDVFGRFPKLHTLQLDVPSWCHQSRNVFLASPLQSLVTLQLLNHLELAESDPDYIFCPLAVLPSLRHLECDLWENDV